MYGKIGIVNCISSCIVTSLPMMRTAFILKIKYVLNDAFGRFKRRTRVIRKMLVVPVLPHVDVNLVLRAHFVKNMSVYGGEWPASCYAGSQHSWSTRRSLYTKHKTVFFIYSEI